jgi:hypothetical protein
MTEIAQELVSTRINLWAAQNDWALVCDPHLRFLTPQLKTVFEVWTSKRESRTMPSRGDLTLRDLKTALPNLVFMNIVRDGARMRLQAKLVGSELERFMGSVLTGPLRRRRCAGTPCR